MPMYLVDFNIVTFGNDLELHMKLRRPFKAVNIQVKELASLNPAVNTTRGTQRLLKNFHILVHTST
jgi:hypothetical protein